MPEAQVSFSIVAKNAAGQVLGNVGTSLDRLGERAQSSGRGLARTENAMLNLATRAIGLEGPLGKVAELMISFAGGSVLTAGFVAGFALTRKAMEMWGASAEEARRKVGELFDAVDKLGRRPDADLLVQKLSLETIAREGRAKLNESRVVGVGPFRRSIPVVGGEERERLSTEVMEAEKRLPIVNKALDKMRGGAEKYAAALDWAAGNVLGFVAAMQGFEQNLRQALTESLVVRLGGVLAKDPALNRQVTLPARGISPRVDELNAQRFAQIDETTRMQRFSQSQESEEKEEEKKARVQAGATRGLIAMTQALAAGQNAVQAFSAGLSQALPDLIKGPWGGIAGMAVGFLGALFKGKKQDVHVATVSSEAAHVIADAVEQPQPDVSIAVYSPTTGELLDELQVELNNRTRSDYVLRLPRGVSLRK